MENHVKRRNFLALLGSAAAWPAFAQGPSAIPTIGFLHARSRGDTAYLVTAFRKALAEGGYEEGRTLKVEWRFADGQYDQLAQMAADLVTRKVTLIFAGSDPAVRAAKG